MSGAEPDILSPDNPLIEVIAAVGQARDDHKLKTATRSTGRGFQEWQARCTCGAEIDWDTRSETHDAHVTAEIAKAAVAELQPPTRTVADIEAAGYSVVPGFPGDATDTGLDPQIEAAFDLLDRRFGPGRVTDGRSLTEAIEAALEATTQAAAVRLDVDDLAHIIRTADGDRLARSDELAAHIINALTKET